MFMRLFFLSLLCLSLMGFTKNGDEAETIDRLMQTTERQLTAQKQLKELILEFKAQQEIFFQGNQTKEHSTKMVRSAVEILKIVKEQSYENLFSPVFMHELHLFSTIAAKKTPGKP